VTVSTTSAGTSPRTLEQIRATRVSVSDDVILYALPAYAENEFRTLIAEGAPLDYAVEGAARIAVAEELRRLIEEAPEALAITVAKLRARADYLDPDGAQ
jgi:hypothetical protein